MSETRHTPGPLAVGVYHTTDAFRAIQTMACVYREDGSLVATFGPLGDVRSEADARLFAAAGEILDAAEALFPANVWRRYEAAHLPERLTIKLMCTKAELMALRAALAKAKG